VGVADCFLLLCVIASQTCTLLFLSPGCLSSSSLFALLLSWQELLGFLRSVVLATAGCCAVVVAITPGNCSLLRCVALATSV